MSTLQPAASTRTAFVLLAAMALAAAPLLGCADDPPGGLLLGEPSGAGSGSGGSGTGAGTGSGTGGTGQGGMAPQPAIYEVSLDNGAPAVDLRDSVDLAVSIAPNGYVGPVALALEGLPGDVTGELASDTVDLDGTTTESVDLTLTTVSSSTTGDFGFTVTGTVDTGVKSADGTLTVRPSITIFIPMGLSGMLGTSGNPNTTAFGDYPTVIKALPNMSAQNPVTVNVFNGDTVPHQIHAGSAAEALGFLHSNQDIPPGQFDPLVREVTGTGTIDYYPHDLNATILGRIVIQ